MHSLNTSYDKTITPIGIAPIAEPFPDPRPMWEQIHMGMEEWFRMLAQDE